MRTHNTAVEPHRLGLIMFSRRQFLFPGKVLSSRHLLTSETFNHPTPVAGEGGGGQGGGCMHPQCRLLTRTCRPPLTVKGPHHRRRRHSTYDKFNLIRYQTWFHLNGGAFHELISHKISDKGLHSERMVGILQRIAVFSVPSVAATRLGATLNACHLQNSGPVLTLKTPLAVPPRPPARPPRTLN